MTGEEKDKQKKPEGDKKDSKDADKPKEDSKGAPLSD